MNISKLKQRLERINPTNLSLPSVLAGSIMSWCLVGNASFAAPIPPDFPKISPLKMATIKGVPSTKILFKLKSIPKIGTTAGTADRGNVQPIDRGSLQPTEIDALGKKFKAKVKPLLKDDPKKYKLNPRLSKVYVAEFPTGTNMEEALKTVKADPTVEYAEINGVVQAVTIPNDPYFDYQWALHNTGQTGGTLDADIDAPEAWEIPPGDTSIVLAVVDTGVDWNHQDLEGKVTLGYDFAYDDPFPDDVYGHGTHVAGIAAANGDEGIGIAGVCWECQILAVKVLDDGGYGHWDWIAEGISYATWNGAKIINLSLGGYKGSEVLHEAIIDAYDAGVTVVAAAGNEYGPPVIYPAKYPEAIAVSATDHNDQLAWFSSYGPEVDIAAPGVDILSSLPGDNYAWGSGTSMATPHVAGAICNCLSLNPSLSPAEIYDLVTTSADDLPPDGWDDYFGAGRLNLPALLEKCGGEGKKECMGEVCTIEGEGGIIYGTSGDDVICGSNQDETILAKAGNDLICAGGGNDIVVADNGHDKVDGGPGDDIIKGGSGKDVLKGGTGKDIILGSTQDDVLVGSTGDDYLHGGNGKDVIFGHDGDDQLCGSKGKDYFNAGSGSNTCDFKLVGADKGGAGCSSPSIGCPIVNSLPIDPNFLTPALVNSINVLNELGTSLDVNQ